tara:strand:+ start:654 stop:1196 length:543 start_codon:yes stop_codon:yes gene_type:complete
MNVEYVLGRRKDLLLNALCEANEIYKRDFYRQIMIEGRIGVGAIVEVQTHTLIKPRASLVTHMDLKTVGVQNYLGTLSRHSMKLALRTTGTSFRHGFFTAPFDIELGYNLQFLTAYYGDKITRVIVGVDTKVSPEWLQDHESLEKAVASNELDHLTGYSEVLRKFHPKGNVICKSIWSRI